MNTIDHHLLLERLHWRYATKQFDPMRKISADNWSALEAALVLSPSSCGLQPWNFVVVNDPAVRAKLLPVSWGQRQIVDASHLVVFAIKTNMGDKEINELIACITEIRKVTAESLAGFRGMVEGVVKGVDEPARRSWATHQVYIALGNLLTSAAVLGIDACPMEGIQPPEYDKILGLTEKNLAAVVACTLGYRAADDKYAALPKVRFPHQKVILHI
jgi:nitroreductase